MQTIGKEAFSYIMVANKQRSNSIPKSVEQVARAGKLGSYFLYSRSSVLSYIKDIGSSLIWFCVGVIAAALVYYGLPSQQGSFNLWDWFVLLCAAAIAIGGMILGGWPIVEALIALLITRPKIYLFEQGLVVLKAGRASSYSWTQVRAIWRSVRDHSITKTLVRYRKYSVKYAIEKISSETSFAGRSHYYQLLCYDGRRLVLDDHLLEIGELGEQVFERAYKVLFATLKNQFTAGETVSFGKIRINQEGIMYEQKRLPWQQVKRCEAGNEFIFIWENGKGIWAQQKLVEMLNASIFLALTNEHLASFDQI